MSIIEFYQKIRIKKNLLEIPMFEFDPLDFIRAISAIKQNMSTLIIGSQTNKSYFLTSTLAL